MKSELYLSAAVDRSLAWTGGNSVRYLVATLRAKPVAPLRATAERPPLNLAIVIDVSGSMSGRPL